MKHVAAVMLASVVYIIGVVVTGAMAPVLHLPVMKAPSGTSPDRMLLLLAVATPLLMAACVPLVGGLGGNWAARWLACGSLFYVAIGLNTMIEAKIFSDVISGSAVAASFYALLPCSLAAAVLAKFFSFAEQAHASAPHHHRSIVWKALVAWLAFPVIYWTFGMCVAPFVIVHYRNSPLGLRIPPPATILGTQLLRSALFLAASFPAIVLWRRSRKHFIVAMGLATAFSVGIFQLIQASFFPMVLRVVHSIEITADSFAFAAVLGMLFIPAASTRSSEPGSERSLREAAVSGK
jgi:hypothetical protein